MVQQVHAVLLTGGSAFGLAAAEGVVQYLEQRGVGFATRAGPVPIVPAAALFDLAVGSSSTRPGPREGLEACRAAAALLPEGSVGAGTGATVGHLRGIRWSTKGGLGTASRQLASGARVGALVAVNAFGDVVEPGTGRVLVGARDEDRAVGFLGTSSHIEELLQRDRRFGEHTTLALVATDADLDRAALTRVAAMAHDGLARAINPAHTGFDGDLVYALATGSAPTVESTIVGALAAEALAEAVVRAVTLATGLGGIPALGEL
jgi:L-aminopeptidase/D-esterase-like protein